MLFVINMKMTSESPVIWLRPLNNWSLNLGHSTMYRYHQARYISCITRLKKAVLFPGLNNHLNFNGFTVKRHLLGAHNISMQQIRSSKTVQAANLYIKRITHNNNSEHSRKKNIQNKTVIAHWKSLVILTVLSIAGSWYWSCKTFSCIPSKIKS